ncbi:alpha/beta fold hydrolase [Thiococcus pfennigii]|uniref:alpha/beta fold hydrolase n=1 Tax=Thiococcus pfennigii TaxID=1057 RepID=UPI001904EC2D|nr:alpha/beta hydrolase [Thiococcus pfennigii]MBK1700078.1 hypothetical protein [Thiococcus pfennigii]
MHTKILALLATAVVMMPGAANAWNPALDPICTLNAPLENACEKLQWMQRLPFDARLCSVFPETNPRVDFDLSSGPTEETLSGARGATLVARHQKTLLQGIQVHVVDAGDPNGEPVLFLHGFPESWWAWKDQFVALGNLGYHVIAVDLPGFNGSQAPASDEDYNLSYFTDLLVGDDDSVLAFFGHSQAHVVAHEWGGILAYGFTKYRNDAIRSLFIINAPHPETFPVQYADEEVLINSWHIPLFQGFPDRAALFIKQFATEFVTGGSILYGGPGFRLPTEHVCNFAFSISGLGKIEDLLKYYRFVFPNNPSDYFGYPKPNPLGYPVKFFWGAEDEVVGVNFLEGMEEYFPNAEIELVAGAGHWIPAEASVRLTNSLIEFLVH